MGHLRIHDLLRMIAKLIEFLTQPECIFCTSVITVALLFKSQTADLLRVVNQFTSLAELGCAGCVADLACSLFGAMDVWLFSVFLVGVAKLLSHLGASASQLRFCTSLS